MPWPVPLPEATGDEAADLAAFLEWEQAIERHYHPGRFGPDGERLPRPRDFTFYLGVPEPSWLNKNDMGPDGAYLCVGIPKFVSAARLARYRSDEEKWPVASACSYAIDSGAYIALTGNNRDVPWFADADVYGGMILRFMANNGYPPDFCAPQDYPCEPAAQRATGLTVRDHQDLTTDSYEWLVREFPMVPWIPVLQGERPGDHTDHAKMYADRGIDLAACHRVGVGSICRLTELDGLVERISQLEDLAAQGLKLHGFGIKTDALPLIGHVLTSADSMAWSAHVRHNGRRNPIRLPGCTHAGDCRNCYRYAVHWREQVLATLTRKKAPVQAVVQPVLAPGNDKDYARLLHDGVLIDLAGRPLTWEPCPDCKGEGTSGVTCPMALECRHCGAKPRRMCKRPSEHDAAELHKARYDDAEADNKRRAAAGDLTVPAPWPKEAPVPTATDPSPAKKTTKPPCSAAAVEQGDLFAGLFDLAALIADKAAAKATPAKKTAARPRRKPKAAAVVVPDDKLVTPQVLAELGAGSLFRNGTSSMLTFDRLEAGDQPNTVNVRVTSGWSFRHGTGERTLRVYTPAEAEFERRLNTVTNPGIERVPAGTVKAGEVADGVFVEATGMLPTGATTTLTGYVITVFTVVRNYQGWTKKDCCAVTISARPEHLDGVMIEMSPDAEMTVLATEGVLRGGLPPLPAGTPAPWTRPTPEALLAETGLTLTGDEQAGPGTVTWRHQHLTPGEQQPRTDEGVRALLLSRSGGPVGNWRSVINQDIVDKAIADGVWPGPVEFGPTPLHLVRGDAVGTLVGQVDGREQSVYGQMRSWWSESAGASCSDTVKVHMKVTTGPAVMDWRMVTVQVPWTGATFHLGDFPPLGGPEHDEPQDLFALLKLTSAIADAVEAGPSTIPLADAAWGAYGKVSAGWVADGSTAQQRTGYVTQTARIYTAGIMGHSKGPKKAGEPLLLLHLETSADGSARSLYCSPDATFTPLPAPADHKMRASMMLSRRLPFADLRPGDVFHIWDERDGLRTLLHRGGSNVADLRCRYHVQSVPRKTGEAAFTVDVLVDGEGQVVELTRAGMLWVDIDDPREQPWHDAGHLELVNPTVRARRALADRLGPDATVLADHDGIVAAPTGVDEATIGEAFGRTYRWWFTHEDGLDFFRPRDGEQHGVIGGRVGAAGDGLDPARAILAAASIENYGLELPRDLDHADWQLVHDVLRGMGATGGGRKREPYTLKDGRLPDLWAFTAGGPAPKHERTTAGWVRTPDKLAADVVARFAELDRLPRIVGHTGCDCCGRIRVLEPSAGDGSLVAAVFAAAPGADLFAVEPDPERAELLRAMPQRFPVHEITLEDFTKRFGSASLKGYDLVVMNPPYSIPGNKGLWALHVKLAWGQLAEGGRLVAILPGKVADPDMRIQAVLDLVGPDVQTEQLPPRSFRQRGKGGTDLDTWVLAATKPVTDAGRARRTYAASIYRPADGEPVKVAEVATTREAAVQTPVQASRDPGGDLVARFVGRCIVCTVSCWGRDDGDNDPRGVLGLNAVAALVADEVRMQGPDVCLCYGCADSSIMRNRGLARARMMWTEPVVEPLTFTAVCPDCGERTVSVPAEGEGDTWKSAEQWLFLAMQDHRPRCKVRAENDAAAAYVGDRIAAALG